MIDEKMLSMNDVSVHETKNANNMTLINVTFPEKILISTIYHFKVSPDMLENNG